jgi:uncharacterized protein YqgV (UPF0045/DUF77 family)
MQLNMQLSDKVKQWLLSQLSSITLPVEQAELATELKAFKDSLQSEVDQVAVAAKEAEEAAAQAAQVAATTAPVDAQPAADQPAV